MRVASLAWCFRSLNSANAFWSRVAVERMGLVPMGANDSRPSHMTAVRNRRFVAGMGRRNSDSSEALAKR